MSKEYHNSSFVVVRFNRPFVWPRNMTVATSECWDFVPERNYVLNANQIGPLKDHVECVTGLAEMPLYKPLRPGIVLNGAKVLVERYRERGIGDLLFLTGPLTYLNLLGGGNLKADMYALADRGMILNGHPTLRFGGTMWGPLVYEDLARYDAHWFIDVATEYNDQPEQENVYDFLYRSIGLEPSTVPPVYKRPSVFLNNDDRKATDQFMRCVWAEKKGQLDLRCNPYYIIAPGARSSLRAMPYGTWLQVIQTLAERHPVVVVGDAMERMPQTDMTWGQFSEQVSALSRTPQGAGVVNAIGATSLRVLLSLMQGAIAVGSMDSGPLYMAQAVRTPAVSVWGVHDPRMRLGYDRDYMDLAIHEKAACRHAPCYAATGFPVDKCPGGAKQTICNPLLAVRPQTILAKFAEVEARHAKA